MPCSTARVPFAALSRRRALGAGLAVAVTSPLLGRRAHGQERSVNVYNWDTYIGESTLDDFTEATGISVRYDLFASNDELFGKLREGNPGYDVIFPSNNFVERMREADMLAPLDHAKIPNLANLAPRFADPDYDHGLKFSACYFWGTQGIGYRQGVAEPKSWADLLRNEKHKGRVAMLNDTDIIRAALKMLGYSLNSSDQAEIDEAAEVLIAAKPNIKAFTPDTGQDLLLSGEVDLVMEWSGDIAQVIEEDEELAYIVPEEGALLWTDNLCIAKGGPNLDSAHEFINYILSAEVHGAIATEVRYACPNQAAMEFIPEEDRANLAIYPSEATLAKCEFATYRGEEVEKRFEDALTRIFAA